MMPGLPGSSLKNDINCIKELFNNPKYQPDLLKIYPCVVTKYSELENWYREGKFKPVTDNDLKNLLTEIKKEIPPYVRIQRLGRDIPATNILAGSKLSNIRQVVLNDLKVKCNCVRCREVKDARIENPKLRITEYKASDGIEYFLEYTNNTNNILYSLLRLRIPLSDVQFDILKNAAIIREIHTYGEQTKIGNSGLVQHKGFGKLLIEKAENIAKENGLSKIAAISGIGAREYYQKLGYKLEDTYMVKVLSTHPPKNNKN
jgi:elongator complex protein 3